MRTPKTSRLDLFRKHIALPQQHGSWALWLGPYAVGIGASPVLRTELLWLTLASLGGFLLLQPLTILTKALAGRRPRSDLVPSVFWILVHGLIGAIGLAGLVLSGNGYILWLALAAAPVLAWELLLVARREERGQMGVELVGAGVLALAAPAALWLNLGTMSVGGGWLWLLCWLQSGGAVVYIYLRLEHRRLDNLPARPERLRLARRSVLYNTANLFVAGALAALGVAPWGVAIAFLAVWAETIYGGLLRPGIGAKPVSIGVRQVWVTAVFAALMVLAYRVIA